MTNEDQIIVAYLTKQCASAEKSARRRLGGKDIPPELTEELSKLPTDTPHGMLMRCVALRGVSAEVDREFKSRGKDDEDVLTQLITRKPVPFTFQNGRRVNITTKSWDAYRRMALIEHEMGLLKAGLAFMEGRGRYQDLPLMRQFLDTLTARENRLLGIALHPDATPAENIEPPAGMSSLFVTPEDWTRLQIAHFEAGPARYQRLPDPAPAEEGSKPRMDRSGFGYFFAQWAKKTGTSVQLLEGEDIYQLIATVYASNETGESATDGDSDMLLNKLGLGGL